MIDSSTSAETLKRLQVMILNFCRLDDGTLLKDINLRRYGMDSGEVVSNTTVQELCVIHPGLLSLDLTNCKSVSDVGVWAIAKHCTSIAKLILFGCEKLTNTGIRSIALRLSKLVHLDLSNCYLVDDISMTVIAAGCWKLEKIYLSNCSKITDNGICRLAQGMGAYLNVLDVRGCDNIGEFGDRALKEIGANCRQLRELFITECKRVEDPGIMAIATGCPFLEKFEIAGCDTVTKKGLKALCRGSTTLNRLKLSGCKKLNDNDFEVMNGSAVQQSLTSLDLISCGRITDRAVANICHALGPTLMQLNLSENAHLTDYATMVIGNLCSRLRELDLSYCCHISDDSVHRLARRVSCLTKLKLDGNPKVSTKAILSHVNKELEFVEMATQWIGYQPKPNVESLIAKKESFMLETLKAIKIQSIIRRKFATKIYWHKHINRLINFVIPIFQAVVRGYLQRKRYRVIKFQMYRIRMAIRIQTKWRNYFAVRERMNEVKRRKFEEHRNKLAKDIQRLYRGLHAKRKVDQLRAELANKRLIEGRSHAMQQIRCLLIQRIYRGWKGRRRGIAMHVQREEDRRLAALREYSMRFIQRIAHGKLGRLKAQRRRHEIAMHNLWWISARHVQRAYRGHLGRLRFKYFQHLRWLQIRNDAAKTIQRVYRGYRGKLLSAVARSLRILRNKQHFYAVELQRVMRGCMGRAHFKIYKELETRRRRQRRSSICIQRTYRGHKGREAREIEKALVDMDSKAQPLIAHLKQLEEAALKLSKVISTMEFYDQLMVDNLHEVERELEHCLKTTNKYTDSSRINSTPQRFLTKFLKVRLKDYLDHETEIHRVKFIELQKKRAELRDLEREIMLAKRELVPLTTGLIADVKRQRTQRLRNMIITRRQAAVKIQALWRRALVRYALYDPYRDYWEARINRDQSDHPYYLNTASKEICWKKPLAYRYFGRQRSQCRL